MKVTVRSPNLQKSCSDTRTRIRFFGQVHILPLVRIVRPTKVCLVPACLRQNTEISNVVKRLQGMGDVPAWHPHMLDYASALAHSNIGAYRSWLLVGRDLTALPGLVDCPPVPGGGD